jgi:hypothetical protein
MNKKEKRIQIIAMLYQNMDKVDADETLKLIDEFSTMAVINNAVLPHVINRRELLIDFSMKRNKAPEEFKAQYEKEVDDYLKSINSL